MSGRVATLLSEAEAAGSCLAASRRADAVALERRLGPTTPLWGGSSRPGRASTCARRAGGEARNVRTFWSLVNPCGIPHGNPPARPRGIPVSARVGGWKPGCGAGGLLLPDGEKISYLAVAV